MLAGYSCSNSRSREEFAEYGSDNRSNDPWFFLYTLINAFISVKQK
jgi:hypothetical protein